MVIYYLKSDKAVIGMKIADLIKTIIDSSCPAVLHHFERPF